MARAKSLPPAEFLRECFHYDSETGDLFWKERPLHHFANEHTMLAANGRMAGRKAGTFYKSQKANTGYLCVNVQYNMVRVQFLCHRVIYKMNHPSFDESKFIDHIDGNGTNNKLDNLRLCTHVQNLRNIRRNKNNTSGHTGVVFKKADRKWQAQISVNGKFRHLGLFADINDAIAARKAAERELGFSKRHGS